MNNQVQGSKDGQCTFTFILYHSYLVCIVLGMPFLLLDTSLNLSILFSVLVVYKVN